MIQSTLMLHFDIFKTNIPFFLNLKNAMIGRHSNLPFCKQAITKKKISKFRKKGTFKHAKITLNEILY